MQTQTRGGACSACLWQLQPRAALLEHGRCGRRLAPPGLVIERKVRGRDVDANTRSVNNLQVTGGPWR